MSSGLSPYAIDANVIVRYVMGDNEGLFEKFVAMLKAVESLEACDGRLYSFDRKLSSVSGIHRSEEPA